MVGSLRIHADYGPFVSAGLFSLKFSFGDFASHLGFPDVSQDCKYLISI